MCRWLHSSSRKPLLIRGARQVGKTWIVRKLAESEKKTLLEINFEKNPQHESLFATNDVKQIILNLSALFNQDIDPEKTILFLDEIQAVPALLAKLRWFSEDLPQLPVLAAGSLLEFTLAEYPFSMPVGRIQFMHLEPMSFEEFLLALNKRFLLDFLKSFELTGESVPAALHDELMTLFKHYLIVGGMPAAVLSWSTSYSLSQVNQIHHDLLSTYRDDFSKYRPRLESTILDKVLMNVSAQLGHKFVYSHSDEKLADVKRALDLLNKARLCHRVNATLANGIPLGAQTKDKYFKQVFLDTGLVSAMLGLHLNELTKVSDINCVHHGALAEQVIGQLLRTIYPPFVEPQLYYWLREEKGSNAELDYVVEQGNQVIPIEVKSGKTGSLKSLHLFMGIKGYQRAIRVNSDIPTQTQVEVTNPMRNAVSYCLISIPFYLISEINRLVK